MGSKVTGGAAEEVPAQARFMFLGNDPALDFLNTLPFVEGVPVERLTDYAALVDFVVEAKLALAEDAAFARRTWAEGHDAEATVARARAVRELLRKIVMQAVNGASTSSQLLAKLNASLRDDAGAYTELRQTEEGFERRLRLRRHGPDNVLAPILRAIAAFLAKADLALVRKCEHPTCAMFFLDTSKNHRRRWCSMELCGNRNKVGAYRARRDGA